MPAFKDVEVECLDEYVKVLKPLAEAIDILEGENDCFLGYLQPSLVTVKKSLSSLHESLVHTKSLSDAILNGLNARFNYIFDMGDSAKNGILASLTHPYFEMLWVPDDHKQYCHNLMFRAAEQLARKQESAKPQPDANDSLHDYFFSFGSSSVEVANRESALNRVHMQCLQYLDNTGKSLDSLKQFPVIEERFRRYNTPIPSSAPVERLLSTGGLIYTERRNGLSDALFEKLLLLKKN